jgi:hypothetical protein
VVHQHPIADGIGGTILMRGDDIAGAILANGQHPGAMHFGDAQGGEVGVILGKLVRKCIRPTQVGKRQQSLAT